MLTMTGCRDVTMQLLCERLYTVRYHWRGRSLLCTGREDCFGCQLERPRPVFYCVASVRFGLHAAPDRSNIVRGVVELCSSAKIQIDRAWRVFGKLPGTIVTMSRRSSKSEWTDKGSLWKEPGNSIGGDDEVMRALATVLRVDDPQEGELFEAWILRAASQHRGLMRGTQLNLDCA